MKHVPYYMKLALKSTFEISNSISVKNLNKNLTLIRQFLGPSPSAISGKNKRADRVAVKLNYDAY